MKIVTCVALLIGVLASGLAYATAPPGYMQLTLTCIDHELAAQSLKKKHGESLKTIAITKDETVILELWTDGKGGSWSIVLHRTRPTNVRCMMSSGKGIIMDTDQIQEKGLAH